MKKIIGSTRVLSFAELGGQLSPTCILDLPMLIFRHNFGHGLKNLFKDFAKGTWNGTMNLGAKAVESINLKKVAENLQNWKVKNKKDIEYIFGVLDASFERSRMLELGFEYDDSFIGKLAVKIPEWMGKYTGMNVLTRSLKTSAAEGEYNFLLRECLKEKPDMAYLAKMGIDETGLSKIKATYEAHGYEKDGLYFLDLEHLNDKSLSNQIQMSIQTIVDQTIMTPGVGDIPRFLRSSYGQFLFMFKTYPYLIYNNFLQHIKQFPKTEVAQSMLATASITCAFQYIKDFINGKETDPTMAEFWKKVFDYSMLSNFITDMVSDAWTITHQTYGYGGATSRLSPTMSAIDKFVALISGSLPLNRALDLIPPFNFPQARFLRNRVFSIDSSRRTR